MQIDRMHALKSGLVQDWGLGLYRALHSGVLDNGRPIAIEPPTGIAGPRAAVLKIYAGLDTERLMKKLTAADGATARQFIPWDFTGDPNIFLSGRDIRIEVGWPEEYEMRDVRISTIQHRPYGSGRFICGISEIGSSISLGFSDQNAHLGVFGATGSGKTVTTQSIITQLSERGDQLILIDGKRSMSLRNFDHLPGVIGPLAIDLTGSLNALSYAQQEMFRRQSLTNKSYPRLVVVVEEIQALVEDPRCIAIIKSLAAQGRETNVNLIITTQRPTSDTIGDPAIGGNLLLRLVLAVANANDSYLATNRTDIRADRLRGSGDALLLKPGASTRLQVARYTSDELRARLIASPQITAWPEADVELIGTAESNNRSGGFSADEVAIGFAGARRNYGRERLRGLLTKNGLSWGAPKIDRLKDYARQAYARWLELEDDLPACLPDAEGGVI